MRKPWEQDYGASAPEGPWSAYGPRTKARNMNRLEAFGRGALDSASFGWADEAAGLINEDWKEGLREGLGDARAIHPMSTMAGELGGAFIPGMGAVKGASMLAKAPGLAKMAAAARNAGPASRVGIAAASGGAGGALYGAGIEDNGSLADRAKGAAIMGAFGAGVGGAAHGILGEVLPRMAGAMYRGSVPEARAADALAETFRRHGVDEAGFEAARKNLIDQEGAMVMDALGGAGTDAVMGAAVRPSMERNVIRDLLDKRNMGARDRVSSALWSNLAGKPPSGAFETVERAIERQKKIAGPMYEEAFKGTKPGHVSSLNRWQQQVRDRDPELFARMEKEADTLMRRFSMDPLAPGAAARKAHFIKMAFDDYYDTATKATNAQGGLGATSRASLIELMRLQRTGLSRSVPGYRAAAEQFAGDAAVRRAVQMGYDLIGEADSLKLGEGLKQLRKMSASEREAAEIGIINKLTDILDRSDSGTGRANVLRGIMGDMFKRRVLEEVFGKKADFPELLRILGNEQKLFENTVNTGIRVNSITADKLAHARSLDMPTTGGGVVNRILDTLQGPAREAYNEKVSDELIRLMRTPVADAENIMSKANKRGLMSQATKRQREIENLRRKRVKAALFDGFPAVVGGGGLFED